MLNCILTALTIVTITAAAIWDIKTRKIPNFITFPAIICGLVFMTVNSGAGGLLDSLGGLFIGAGLLFVFFALGAMGAGDVKLLAAVGALNGIDFIICAFIYTALAGGIIALGILYWKGQLYNGLLNIYIGLSNVLSRIKKRQRRELLAITTGLRFPYGVAIFIGTVMAYIMRCFYA